MRLIDADALIAKFESAKQGSDLRDTLYLCGVQAVIATFPTLESPRDWTPCAEGLPTKAGTYLVTYKESSERLGIEWKRDVCRARFTKAGWTFNRMACRTVLAWQPLPAPYRADDTTGKPDHIRDTAKKVEEDTE